jgi:lipoprotein-anchoring transpeptidase ErfK/SrfK
MRISKQRSKLVGIVVTLPLIPFLLTNPTRSTSSSSERAVYELRVDLSERTMALLESGDVVRTYDVAVGRRTNPTPKGTFRTGRIDWNPAWNPPDSDWARNKKPRAPGDPQNPMQGVKIYFREPAYYIHGTNDPGSIGQAASRGCIRMRAKDAIAVANWIEERGGTVTLVIKG